MASSGIFIDPKNLVWVCKKGYNYCTISFKPNII
jgi:hypothetical protein